MYADDTTLLVKEKTLDAAKARTTVLKEVMVEWFTANKLPVNNSKTKSLMFTTRHHTEQGFEQSVKLLGVMLDSNLHWTEHCTGVAEKVAQNCFLLRRLKACVSPEILRVVYFAKIHSLLRYGILVWGHSSAADIVFKAQRRAVRIMSGLPFRADCRDSFAGLGILTLPSVWILECLLHVHGNKSHFPVNADYHTYDTRRKEDFHLSACRLKRQQAATNYWAVRLYNKVPPDIRSLPERAFKSRVLGLLSAQTFYSKEEFLSGSW